MARYFHHDIWLASVATILAVIGWIILFIPLSPTPLVSGLKFGLVFSAPVNFIVVPLAYRLLPHQPDGATFLRVVGLAAGFATPYLSIFVWRPQDMFGRLPLSQGDNIANNLLLIPFMVLGALAGITYAKAFIRFGEVSSLFDLRAVMTTEPNRDLDAGIGRKFGANLL